MAFTLLFPQSETYELRTNFMYMEYTVIPAVRRNPFAGGEVNISQFFQASPNVFLFKHAPVRVCTGYLQVLGTLYYWAKRQERAQIENNILDVFQSRNDAKDIIRGVFRGIFFHYSEKLIVAHRNYTILKRELHDMIEYSGLHLLDDALQRGGVVMVTGHFGGVEYLPLALALRGYPVTMIVSFQTERLRESLMERAAEVEAELIDGHRENVMFQAIRALKRGRILLTECDEVDTWKPRENQTIQAFGGNVLLDRSLEVLCRRTGSTVLGSFMVRTGRGYRLSIVPIGDPGSEGEGDMSAAILRMFEQFVMMFPDQWYQWSKFHKMRPETA